MFTCTQCGRQFETEASLRSHCAWHKGILKSWKDAANVRESSASQALWMRNGKKLVQGFLSSILPDTVSPNDVIAMRDKIYEMILAAIK